MVISPLVMKTTIVLFALFLEMTCATAQSASGSPSGKPEMQETIQAASSEAKQTNIDPGKRADIQRLMDVAGTRSVMLNTMGSMTSSMKPLLVNSLPPGDYRDKLIGLFLERFQANADLSRLLDLAVPVYDKYFSDEEIKGLIKFYESPLGHKTVSLLPQIMTEMTAEGQRWGGELGRQTMQQVLAENPDLADQLKAAAAKQK
jgi:uncharacterized protein